MSVAIITGSAGLVGSEAAAYFAAQGMRVVGIDNDMRAQLFGAAASTRPTRERLQRQLRNYHHHDIDIRNEDDLQPIFRRYSRDLAVVIHAAAQPSHDWATRNPHEDFTINALGTLALLDVTRQHAPDAVFIFTSTNKVYGDRPNSLPLMELEQRWEIDQSHSYADGISESMSIDASLHSLFGVSKTAADLFVQEYGRNFGLRTACFRCGCLSGPNHVGVKLHGFLSYLMRCTLLGDPYTVFGYQGKQVRDNIHSRDLVRAFDAFFREPRAGEIYNMGGGRFSNCSMLEAIDLCQRISDRELAWTYRDEHRRGDHKWWISDVSRFKSHYPGWRIEYDVPSMLEEIAAAGRERWRPDDSTQR